MRNDSGINTVEDLRGKTVSVGEEESGVVDRGTVFLSTFFVDKASQVIEKMSHFLSFSCILIVKRGKAFS
ncbi:MAG: hypothetical protein IJT81_03000 [Lachnospiraceae bacterium]|nr:hypothetical protein [Lachnospiraceae bacterium]